MNYAIVFALVGLFGQSSAAGPSPRIFEDEIIKMLECVRGVLKTGIEEVGLPSCEPLAVGHLVVNVTELNIHGAKGHVTLENALISGLTDWKLSDLKLDLNIIGGLGGSLAATLDLPQLLIETDYIADVSLAAMNVFGSGVMSMELGHLGIAADAKILLNRITLERMRLLPSIGSIKFDITGFLNDEEHSELVSQIVNDIAVDWINEKSEDFADLIEEVLQGLINHLHFERNVDFGEIINAVLERCPLPIK